MSTQDDLKDRIRQETAPIRFEWREQWRILKLAWKALWR